MAAIQEVDTGIPQEVAADPYQISKIIDFGLKAHLTKVRIGMDELSLARPIKKSEIVTLAMSLEGDEDADENKIKSTIDDQVYRLGLGNGEGRNRFYSSLEVLGLFAYRYTRESEFKKIYTTTFDQFRLIAIAKFGKDEHPIAQTLTKSSKRRQTNRSKRSEMQAVLESLNDADIQLEQADESFLEKCIERLDDARGEILPIYQNLPVDLDRLDRMGVMPKSLGRFANKYWNLTMAELASKNPGKPVYFRESKSEENLTFEDHKKRVVYVRSALVNMRDESGKRIYHNVLDLSKEVIEGEDRRQKERLLGANEHKEPPGVSNFDRNLFRD